MKKIFLFLTFLIINSWSFESYAQKWILKENLRMSCVAIGEYPFEMRIVKKQGEYYAQRVIIAYKWHYDIPLTMITKLRDDGVYLRIFDSADPQYYLHVLITDEGPTKEEYDGFYVPWYSHSPNSLEIPLNCYLQGNSN